MNENCLTPRKSLNKAYLKIKPTRSVMESFKKNLILLLDGLDETESEEHNKNDLGDFLKNTFYQPGYYINTRDRADLVIHTGADSKSRAGVLIEVKKPGNRNEMVSKENLKAKAFYELILYYLRERITGGNLEIKHLIATNVYEWFIFDAAWFEKNFAQNREFVKQFTDFEQGRLSGTTTDFFYTSIAEPFVRDAEGDIPFTWFDFREYDKPLRNENKEDDTRLISLFKVLSPEHLLKLPFVNDSNTLDKSFYAELLHIIGLSETKSGSKKVIERKKEGQRDPGSLIENTIAQLDKRDKISRLPNPSAYGETHPERLFNVSLELVITWLNRILFLKLLEAQLIRYHKGDAGYGFLNGKSVAGFDDLDNLFFSVLAKRAEERDPELAAQFSKIPYLNSSLFEPTELEQVTIFISNLQDQAPIPILSSTVLKDAGGKRKTGKPGGLQYLFEFLDAYDFAGEGAGEIQEDNKTLINASVLGLIFEKINGYKDGSFFTPGFITMYMCRETIRRAVVQKFNEAKGWGCETLDQLYDKIEDRQEANRIINTLRICDPAVGSGHFLVSALNEIIAIKSDLKILSDREGRRLKEYRVEVANDELVITDEEGDLFEYLPGNNESQRIQEALFHEKQTIIENCLFGVDINPNSVKICRLRLWIELLKNAYYKTTSTPHPLDTSTPQHLNTLSPELETLPNIDINIKCGNSLISRYALDADIREALKKSKWSIDSYRLAVSAYRNAATKEEKRSMEQLIRSIKSDFETEVAANDKRLIQLKKLKGELFALTQQTSLFDQTKKEKEAWNKKVKELTSGIQKLETGLEEIKNNRIYENAFEWRFEFPEVLNDEGDFVGFDVVIGNPPYVPGKDLKIQYKALLKASFEFISGKYDLYIAFLEQGIRIQKSRTNLCFIIPNTYLANENATQLRKHHVNSKIIRKIVILSETVFPEAFVESVIVQLDNYLLHKLITFVNDTFTEQQSVDLTQIDANSNYRLRMVSNSAEDRLIEHIMQVSKPLGEIVDFCIGIQIGGEGDSKDFKGKYIASQKLSDDYQKVIDGKDFSTYNINWTGKFIKYGAWLHRKRDIKYFLSPKLIIRQIGETPYVSIDKSSFYTLNTIYNGKLLSTDYTLEFIFALINSKLIKFLWRNKFFDGKSLFPKIKKSQLNAIPIVLGSSEFQQSITSYVNEIFRLKESDPEADITSYESEIDRLVYELYGLTEEEIRIVEGK